MDLKLKAIVSSGHEHDPIMVNYTEYGFCAAIAKPYEIAKLSRVVRDAVQSNPVEQRKSA